MDNLALCLVLLFGISLLPNVTPVLTFFVCFYIGFKLICKDLEVEMAVRDWIARRIRNFINRVEEMDVS